MAEDDVAQVEQVTELRFQFKGKFAELTLPDEMLEAIGGIERLSGYLAGINDGEERGILHMLKPAHGWVPIIVGRGYMAAPPASE